MADQDDPRLMDRYQYQPWYVKLWRWRFMIPTYHRALFDWWPNRGKPMFNDPECRNWTYRDFLSLEKGMANSKMKWYYTMDEVKEHLEQKRKKRRKKRRKK